MIDNEEILKIFKISIFKWKWVRLRRKISLEILKRSRSLNMF